MNKYEAKITNVEEAKTRLSSLPMLPKDDPRVLRFIKTGERAPFPQYGNNFYLLWLALENDGIPKDAFIKEIYLGQAEKHPGWTEFLETETEAISSVFNTMNEYYHPYNQLAGFMINLVNSDQMDAYSEIDQSVPHPFGAINAANYLVWDEMSVVLKAVETRMSSHGIIAREFFA